MRAASSAEVSGPAGGELAIEAEAVADDDQRGVDRGAELDDGLAEERVQALLVDRGVLRWW